MLKPVLAATAILAIGGSSLVYAQQRFEGHGDFGRGFGEHHRRLSAEDFSAFADARIAALKAGLELTPDQAKNWPPFEAALRNMVQLRAQHIQARQAAEQQAQTQQSQTQAPASPFDRLSRRADTMTQTGAALKQIADAGAPLYQSLTDAQKGRFTVLARILRPHRDHADNDGNWRQGRRDDRDGRRFGQNEQDGRGWGYGHRFSQNDQDGQGWRHHHQDGRSGMHNPSGGDTDQGSQL